MKKFLCLMVVSSIALMNYSCTDAKSASYSPTNKEQSLQISTETAPGVYHKELLPKLQFVISKLENNEIDYDWKNAGSCNVGLFAQLVTDKTSYEVKQEKEKYGIQPTGEWRIIISNICGITGKPITGIIQELLKAGFNRRDICNLELLSDKYILSHSNINIKEEDYYASKDNLVKYLKSWAELIKQQ